MNTLLLEVAEQITDDTAAYSTSLVAVYVIGFVAAAFLGSVAWYNSKRPRGWENKERPAAVPDLDKSEFINNEPS
ncbi:MULTISPECIES: hypothetical protein [unclassified Leptolyngbya]|uniref:photosystem II assembly protein Psb35 n=1 Tax=unclassified Leptolyngbya TaxID=2650499 RepID=UPI00168664D1|nr:MULTISPECIES: hypothetical protein [unclassified Leptolyngbya]MBD1909735.1 hypothetical protein [Leptolyngbya sp. FACHB-8]MBD2156311.1 hypothetical protein [Leptolyngbya sp. FACHB-16]